MTGAVIGSATLVHNVLVAQVSTQVFGTMEEPRLGQTARAATPAAVAAAMPRCGGAAQRRGEITSQRRTSQRLKAPPECMIVIDLAADLSSSICDAYRR